MPLSLAIDKAIAEAGIAVVTLDAEVYGSQRRDTFLGTGNVNAGHGGAASRWPSWSAARVKVAILTKVGQSNLEERIQGYKDEFAARTFPTSNWSRSSTTRAIRPRQPTG